MGRVNAGEMTFKQVRQKMGLTQKQVSDIYGIPYSTIQNWEYGINNPPEYVLSMMMELYHLRGISNMIGERSNT